MFAVIKTGGKQYRVQQGSIVRVDRMQAEPGEVVRLTDVLMTDDSAGNVRVGQPFLAGVSVEATVVDQMRTKKIIVFKKKRRHNYRRKKGHRQHLTVLQIGAITASAK